MSPSSNLLTPMTPMSPFTSMTHNVTPLPRLAEYSESEGIEQDKFERNAAK